MKQIEKVHPWIQNIYNPEEEKAMASFTEFSKHFKSMYARSKGTPYGTFFDVANINHTGGTTLVELKLRDAKAFNYNDVYIEPEKWNNLITAWRSYNNMPIYINFFGDYKKVAVWYLPMIVTPPRFYMGVKVKTDEDKVMIVDRLGLAMDNAYIYTWNEAKQGYDIKEPAKIKKLDEKAIYYQENNNPRTKQYFEEI